MTKTLLLVILFVAAIGSLPWLIRRLQQRRGEASGLAAGSPRVVSAIAVGPHQRVVTVEVGVEGERVVLVLGVTGQQIQCLHTMHTPVGATGLQSASFASQLVQADSSNSREILRKPD